MQESSARIRTITACLLLWSFPGLTTASEAQSFRLPAPGVLLPRAAEPGTPAGMGEGAKLRIVVVSGENGVNVLRNKSVVHPVVEVRDAQDHPVPGALVTFAAPSGGAGVVFGNDLRTATALTDDKGRASVTDVQARNTGAFTYAVTAQYHEELASAAIHQVNFARQSDAAGQSGAGVQSTSASGMSSDHRGISNKGLWLIVGGVGAAATGLAFGLAKGGSSHTSTSVPTTTIGPGGTPTVSGTH